MGTHHFDFAPTVTEALRWVPGTNGAVVRMDWIACDNVPHAHLINLVIWDGYYHIVDAQTGALSEGLSTKGEAYGEAMGSFFGVRPCLLLMTGLD